MFRIQVVSDGYCHSDGNQNTVRLADKLSLNINIGNSSAIDAIRIQCYYPLLVYSLLFLYRNCLLRIVIYL